jgi:hypothetical protein
MIDCFAEFRGVTPINRMPISSHAVGRTSPLGRKLNNADKEASARYTLGTTVPENCVPRARDGQRPPPRQVGRRSTAPPTKSVAHPFQRRLEVHRRIETLGSTCFTP